MITMGASRMGTLARFLRGRVRTVDVVCRLSRCSMEWSLPIGSLGMAAWLAMFPYGLALRSYVFSVAPPGEVTVVPFSWVALLLMSGLAQMAATIVRDPKLIRWAALFSGIVWIYFGVSAYKASLVLITWPCLWMVGQQLYVSVMFRR